MSNVCARKTPNSSNTYCRDDWPVAIHRNCGVFVRCTKKQEQLVVRRPLSFLSTFPVLLARHPPSPLLIMPRRFVVLDDDVQSEDYWSTFQTMAQHTIREYDLKRQYDAFKKLADEHVPAEAYTLLAAASCVMMLHQIIVTLYAWRMVRRHRKLE